MEKFPFKLGQRHYQTFRRGRKIIVEAGGSLVIAPWKVTWFFEGLPKDKLETAAEQVLALEDPQFVEDGYETTLLTERQSANALKEFKRYVCTYQINDLATRLRFCIIDWLEQPLRQQTYKLALVPIEMQQNLVAFIEKDFRQRWQAKAAETRKKTKLLADNPRLPGI